ncbi:DUF3135 domain-containing protein [Oxalobacteraceae bacterium OM1]|nr:DUF3135 domain-containing protein [Oxalobacteraceae bacterium OM1]
MHPGPRLPEFDVLVALHQHDPEAFEAFRRHVLKEAVDFAPADQRPALEALLLRIEEERAKASTPMEAVLGATRMMQESVQRLNEGWDQAREAVAGLHAALVIERVRY